VEHRIRAVLAGFPFSGPAKSRLQRTIGRERAKRSERARSRNFPETTLGAATAGGFRSAARTQVRPRQGSGSSPTSHTWLPFQLDSTDGAGA
jgi:hypothetical protein